MPSRSILGPAAAEAQEPPADRGLAGCPQPEGGPSHSAANIVLFVNDRDLSPCSGPSGPPRLAGPAPMTSRKAAMDCAVDGKLGAVIGNCRAASRAFREDKRQISRICPCPHARAAAHTPILQTLISALDVQLNSAPWLQKRGGQRLARMPKLIVDENTDGGGPRHAAILAPRIGRLRIACRVIGRSKRSACPGSYPQECAHGRPEGGAEFARRDETTTTWNSPNRQLVRHFRRHAGPDAQYRRVEDGGYDTPAAPVSEIEPSSTGLPDQTIIRRCRRQPPAEVHCRRHSVSSTAGVRVLERCCKKAGPGAGHHQPGGKTGGGCAGHGGNSGDQAPAVRPPRARQVAIIEGPPKLVYALHADTARRDLMVARSPPPLPRGKRHHGRFCLRRAGGRKTMNPDRRVCGIGRRRAFHLEPIVTLQGDLGSRVRTSRRSATIRPPLDARGWCRARLPDPSHRDVEQRHGLRCLARVPRPALSCGIRAESAGCRRLADAWRLSCPIHQHIDAFRRQIIATTQPSSRRRR